MLFVCHFKILHIISHCFQFFLGPFSFPRETEDNACAKFWGNKQRALSVHVMVFSVVVNYEPRLIFCRIVSHLFKDARYIDVIGNIIVACCQMR